MDTVNKTHEQTRNMTWGHIARFAVYGGLKLLALGIVLWILRHI